MRHTISVFWSEFCRPLAALDRCKLNKGAFTFKIIRGALKWPLKGGSRLIEVAATAGLTVHWKVLEKHSKALKSPWILPFTGGFNTDFWDLNQYKIVVPLFGAAYAAPKKGTTILYSFSKTNIICNAVYHFRSRILTLKSGFFINF